MERLSDYVKSVWTPPDVNKVEAQWVGPVGLRVMHYWVVPGFLRWRDEMSPDDRRRITALLLIHAYLAAREEVSPMRNILGGHPNFMADWKYPLMAGAFLFPNHPMAREWADQYQKFLDLQGIFHVRPDVKAWDAKGGRWTESIGVYNWASIDPAADGGREYIHLN